MVDDFGIKYTNLADVTHLQNALYEQYEITTDMTGSLYCGLTLAWNYNQRHVDVSMNYGSERDGSELAGSETADPS